MCFRLGLDLADLRFLPPAIGGGGGVGMAAGRVMGAGIGVAESPGVDAKFPLALTVAYVNPPAVIAIIPYINTGNP